MKAKLGLGPNPVGAIEITHGRTWKDWQEAWKAATELDELISLLHTGFSVKPGAPNAVLHISERRNIVLFYLACANGWQDSIIPFNDNVMVMSQKRRKLMSKAFDVLADRYFSRVVDARHPPFFTSTLNGKLHDNDYFVARLLPYLTDFFGRVNEIGYFELRNFRAGPESSHSEKVALQFLRKLVHNLLCIEPGKYEPGKHFAKRLIKAHQWAIEVLSALGEIDTIVRYGNWLVSASYDKLKEIAYRQNPPFVGNTDCPTFRWPSLNVALQHDSAAAWALRRLEANRGLPSSFGP